MDNERKVYLCKNLCDMFRALLVCAYELDRLKQLMKYLFLITSECDVVYRTDKKEFFYAYFRLYDADDISIEIHGLGDNICGYINDTKVWAVDLSDDIIYEMNRYVEAYWDAMKDKVTFEFTEMYDDNHTVVNILG